MWLIHKVNPIVERRILSNSSDSLIKVSPQHWVMRAHNKNKGDEITKEESRKDFTIRRYWYLSVHFICVFYRCIFISVFYLCFYLCILSVNVYLYIYSVYFICGFLSVYFICVFHLCIYLCNLWFYLCVYICVHLCIFTCVFYRCI